MLDLIYAVLHDNLPVGHLIDHLQLDRNTGAFGPRLGGFVKVPKIRHMYMKDLRLVFFDLLVTLGTPEERKQTWEAYRYFREISKLHRIKPYKPGLKLKALEKMIGVHLSSSK